MSLSETIVEVSKYLAASGVVGVAGVVLNSYLNQRHESQRDNAAEDRLRKREWMEFQKSTVIELQDLMWSLFESIGRVQMEVNLLRMGASDIGRVQSRLEEVTKLLRRVDILSVRIESDTLRESAEKLRACAYHAMPGESDEDPTAIKQPYLDSFTSEYNSVFRESIRQVIREIIVNC